MGQSSPRHPPTLRGQTGSPWWGERDTEITATNERKRENGANRDTAKKARRVLTGSSCTAVGLKGTLQRPNSWESTLISLCLGDTTFTWRETDDDQYS